MEEHKFSYEWYLKNGYPAKGINYHGKKVFSCFACGGGSTMGYKLAGYDVLGCNEIDPRMIEVYKENHHPKYAFCEGIQTFKERDDLPEELFNLDILDGSPPCSSFSISGQREKMWGKEKKFREGQANQILDTLFFDFIDLAKRLQPKVVIAENVKGLLAGNAKEYVVKINNAFRAAGYHVEHYLLDASRMGVPQKRERVFFVAVRNDIAKNFTDLFGLRLNMNFNEKEILFKEIYSDSLEGYSKISDSEIEIWKNKIKKDLSLAETLIRLGKKGNRFNTRYIHSDKVNYTITAADNNILYDIPRKLNLKEYLLSGTFPQDYNFLTNRPNYLIGMSVPPIMTAQVSTRVYEQILSKI